MRQNTGWVIALTGIGSLMAALDTLVVSTALSTIRVDLGASVEALEWTVNAYNLSFAVLLITAAALGDRYGRRNLYAVGLGAVHASASALLRARARRRLADRRARALQGVGRGARDAARPRAAERRLPARAARRGDRDLQRDHRPLRRGRAARRRRRRRGPRLGVDLLAQRPDRRWSRSRSCSTRMRESRGPDAGLDIPGLALVTAGVLGIVWGLVRGNAAGWGSTEVRRVARGRARCWSRPSSPGSCARASRCCRCDLFRLARLLGEQRGDVLHVRLAVQRRVLLRAVPADRARLRPARGRPAADAMDGDLHHRGARSPARSPTGSASAR